MYVSAGLRFLSEVVLPDPLSPAIHITFAIISSYFICIFSFSASAHPGTESPLSISFLIATLSGLGSPYLTSPSLNSATLYTSKTSTDFDFLNDTAALAVLNFSP